MAGCRRKCGGTLAVCGAACLPVPCRWCPARFKACDSASARYSVYNVYAFAFTGGGAGPLARPRTLEIWNPAKFRTGRRRGAATVDSRRLECLWAG